MLAAKDQLYQQFEAYVNNNSGRSYYHRRFVEGQAAYLLHAHDVAVDEIYRREMRKIVDNQPKDREVVTVTRYEEVRPKGLMGYLFNR